MPSRANTSRKKHSPNSGFHYNKFQMYFTYSAYMLFRCRKMHMHTFKIAKQSIHLKLSMFKFLLNISCQKIVFTRFNKIFSHSNFFFKLKSIEQRDHVTKFKVAKILTFNLNHPLFLKMSYTIGFCDKLLKLQKPKQSNSAVLKNKQEFPFFGQFTSSQCLLLA